MTISPQYSLSIVSLLAFLLGLSCIDQGHNWADDFALYLEQCQALDQGTLVNLLEQNRYAMDNSYAHVGPYLYPSGFPLLLLPMYQLWGMNLWLMKVYCLLFFIASIPLVYFIFKRVSQSSSKAFIITLLVALNYHFIRFSDHILSDLPFFFFSLLCVYQIQQQKYKRPQPAFLLGLLIFFSYNIRDIGICLLPCLLVHQYYSKPKLALWILGLPYFAFIVSAGIRYCLLPSTGSELLQLLSTITLNSILNNLYYYWLLIGNYFVIFRGLPLLIQGILASLVCGIIGIGLFKTKISNPSIVIYIGTTIGIYLLWVSFQGMRFLFPVLPFLVFYLIEGIYALIPSTKKRKIVLGTLVTVSLIQSLGTSVYYWQKDTNEAHSAELQSIYQFIRQETPEKALIIFQKPRALRLFTGRNSIQKPLKEAQYSLVKRDHTVDNTASIIFQTANYTLVKHHTF
ncbi:phospholipid carrier-dependent glycosyltransferase [Aureispira anguillae]|uniref:Phospholipid carrier-dependent glycosyltransferase n=1 Tax=Aureispira anguillae TaxID=2864201 RepID=A0A916DQC5_9BACT|nr:phospholipid carrier-dependent glycosyltransferase [Aureispira anguillae]BDS10015.1 phospholipid carrier-dependent glycosyltransferase [Aureispira anguillae]